ncbi:FAD-dependent monooxygenase [Pseudonocardia halophobica]|uniref:FAD-dependent monooxygenase n=1 Tax=Pseudonocardia halophobica TaxID=29401 RepID=UPI003D8BC2F6
MDTTDVVLVVGAGPVGLTTACQLARQGVPVRIVDALEQPTTESRAVGVHARSMEMLAALGVLPRLEVRGRRIDALEILDGRTGATRTNLDVTGVPSRHPYVLDVPQPDTEAVLADRAAELGVVVERGVTLTALTQDADGVDVTLRTRDGEETARVGWVVGADGGHSSTRTLAGAKLEGGFHGQHFAMADVDIDTAWAPDTIRMFQHPDGMGILFPLAGTRARIMFFVDDPGSGAPDPTLAQIQALADARMGRKVTVRDPRWLTYFEVHHAQVPRYRLGRVLLAGDAAHIHSPAGAQGMNTGIQDAANLAWKLALVARHRADAALLDSYHDERHPVGAMVVRTTTTLTNVGTASGPEAAVRDVAMVVVGHLPRVAGTGAATLAETTIGYRDSTLAVHRGHHRHGAARAGEHAPDPDGLLRPDGSPVTVEGLLGRPGMVLLVRTGEAATVDELRGVLGDLGTVVRVVSDAGAAGECVLDPDDVLGRAYGLGSEGLALIRPDGYLGLVADQADAAALRAYLADTLRIGQPSTV